ncbi:MAG: hypothetical protein LBH96_04485 [Candidatus Peribacteria bacterium]|jgi:hypothetical protein|nr:hypothetical protein [Candidatus Peribacteria bacterium]
MANLNNSSAQQLFEKMQEKKLNASQLSLETLTQQLKAEMKNEFDLSGLNYEDWRNLYGEIGKLIKNAKGLSELDKKRYLVLRRELAFRFPPKLQLTEEAKGKLISRDSLADDIRANREANQGE